MDNSTRTDKVHLANRTSKMERDERLMKRFNEIYKDQGKRLDLVWSELYKEFFIGKLTIQRRLKAMDENYLIIDELKNKIDGRTKS